MALCKTASILGRPIGKHYFKASDIFSDDLLFELKAIRCRTEFILAPQSHWNVKHHYEIVSLI